MQVMREKDASSLSLPVRSPQKQWPTHLHSTRLRCHVLLSEGAGPAQLTIAGAAQAASYSALGYLVLHDTNIWGPNAAGLCANVVCLVLIGVYGSQGGKAGKQPRD